MKRTIIIISIVVAFAGLGIITIACGGGQDAGDEDVDLYTCGMHPDVIQDGPGLCPICNMNLTPLKADSGSDVPEGERRILYWVAPMDPLYVRDKPGKSPMGMDLVPIYEDEVMSGTGVTIDPAMIQSIGVRFENVRRGPLEKSIHATAHVDYNEDNLVVVSTRTDGWIEKLHVTSPGTTVNAGDPLFDFYAPKLFSAQEEYLIALRSGDNQLIVSARERLKLLGVADAEIADIRRNGSRRALTIVAPIDGTVVAMGSSGGMSGGGDMSGMGGMSGMTSMTSSGGGRGMKSEDTLREGDYVGLGTPVYTIADLSSLWVYAHVYDDELQYVKAGMPAQLELNYLPGQVFDGVIDIVYPFLDIKTRDIKLRLTFLNPEGKLMPQMFGTVHIQSRIADDTLLIPEEAVIYTGHRRIVLLALPAGKFAPQEVKVGPADDNGNIQVLSGLIEGQLIVTSAQFLIDSESRLREALNKMLESKLGKATDEDAAVPDEHAGMDMTGDEGWPNLAPDNPEAKFRCPMPDDRYYAAEEGNCPICGMILEPHDPEAYAREHDDS